MRPPALVPVLLALGCGSAPPAPEVHFVRGGVVTDGVFHPEAWRPGVVVAGVVAPKQAECVAMFHVELEDQSRGAVLGAPPPGAALAFSPDGTTLAVGSMGGALRLVDAETGAPEVSTRIGEGAVKRIAWSTDGATLYVGEQSPDAYLLALDPTSLQPRWKLRLADDLETSPLPTDEDIYGRYALPAAFAIRVLDGGDLLVAGSHGWTDTGGARHNRTRLWRLGPDGAVRAAFPPDHAADAIMLFPSVHGDRVLAGVSRSADGPDPADLPVGGLIELDLGTLRPRWTTTFPVLAPWFKEVFLWEAVVAGPGFAFAGLGDGRAFLFDADGAPRRTLSPGVPIQSGGVPIAAGVGFAAAAPDGVWFETTSTNIPWGSADPMTRPPTAHPAQYTLHAVDTAGVARWSRSFEHAIEGVVPSPDGRTLLLGASTRSADTRTDLFGGVLVDAADGALLTTCSTEGPVDFRPVWAPDNLRIALTEAPFLVDQQVRGAYRVTVFR